MSEKTAPVPTAPKSLEARINDVTAREEARLLRVARESGYFDRRVISRDAKAMFAAFLKTHSARQSQLARLKQEKKRMAARVSEEQRRLDARRKILLGSFLIAQFEHDKNFLTKMQPELDKFLSLHKDPNVAESNKEALAQWLGPLAVVPATGTAPEAKEAKK